MMRTSLRHVWDLLVLLVMLGAAASAQAEPASASASQDRRPPAMRKVQLHERLGTRLPLDTPLRDAHDRPVTLGDYFDRGTPVLLTLAYVKCPMLCSLVLRGVAEAAHVLSLSPPQKYRLVTVGIDPRETAADALARQQKLNQVLDGGARATRWTYLRGEERHVRAIADALGFDYAWDQRTESYAHPAAAFVITGRGFVSKYFHGVSFPPGPLESALVTAADGEVGSAVGQSVLSCFLFDPALRKHRKQIRRYFQVGAITIFGSLLLLVGALFAWEHKRRR